MARRSPPSPRRGFALLMVVVLVALAGVTLAGIASRSLVGAATADAAVDDLQRRWAVTSLRQSLLGRAGLLLRDAEARAAESAESGETAAADAPDGEAATTAVASLWLSCELAGGEFEILITDEQTRMNAGRVAQAVGESRAEAWTRQLARDVAVTSTQRSAVRVELRPRRLAAGAPGAVGEVASFGQVFPEASGEALFPGEAGAGLASRITCWGDGRLHLRRTPSVVIDRVCRTPLGPRITDAILQARRESPALTLDRLLTGIEDLTEEDREAIESLLADHSSAFGLWIVERDRARSRVFFSVLSAVNSDGVGGDVADAPDNAGEASEGAAVAVATPGPFQAAQQDFAW